ncbi:MAG TPA: cupin domain-containing protein [Candidatus Baltobacteraceae bacterium]|nr:cupin domain-containing protein [Candidatus Baltobacteraceae bacterium]
MNVSNVLESQSWFSVLQTAERAQTAVMSIGPGEASGAKENEHPDSEQVLYVIEGELVAEIGERSFIMHAGDSTIVRRNVPHRFTNRGERAALTFNVYAPPAY